MSEHAVQTLYAVFTTLALAIGIRTFVADNLSYVSVFTRKPFTCVYCLTFWCAIPVVLVLMPDMEITDIIVSILVVHILAFIANQKLI